MNCHFTVVLALCLFVRTLFKQQGEGVAVGNVVEAETADQTMQIAGFNRLIEQLLFFPATEDRFQQIKCAAVDWRR